MCRFASWNEAKGPSSRGLRRGLCDHTAGPETAGHLARRSALHHETVHGRARCRGMAGRDGGAYARCRERRPYDVRSHRYAAGSQSWEERGGADARPAKEGREKVLDRPMISRKKIAALLLLVSTGAALPGELTGQASIIDGDTL